MGDEEFFDEFAFQTMWEMNHKIWKVLAFVKQQTSVNYLQNKFQSKQRKKIREAYFEEQSKKDKKNKLLLDFIFTAYMLGIKELIN